VPAHLQEPAVVGPLFAEEDGVHRRLQVIVDPARAGPLEEGEGPIVAVEHHLLALARIRPHERHPAVAEPQMRALHNRRHALEHDDLVAPVELVGLAGREAQRHEGRRRRALLAPPSGRVTPHRVVAAGIAETAQPLEQPHQRQPFPARPCRVRCQKPFQLLPPRPHLGAGGGGRHWSLTTLREKLVKIGARIVRHGRYIVFQLAEVAVPRALFTEILRRIERLRLRPPAPA
jgi:Transposase DDE domain group 1